MKKIKLLLDQCFNYQLNFQSWSDKKFVAFLKELIAGKTEYYLDEYFPIAEVKAFLEDK
tara:strand:- start:4818 stop:4994 length:177 start_codon:yes stop_codon:yes gene_type:complete